MPKITFVNEKLELDVAEGANLRSAARKAGIALHGVALTILNPISNVVNCRGNGLCGTCRVLVNEGTENLSPKTTIEQANLSAHPESLLPALEDDSEIRLACQCAVQGDCSILTHPPYTRVSENFWHKPYPSEDAVPHESPTMMRSARSSS
jgi:ferredoxin